MQGGYRCEMGKMRGGSRCERGRFREGPGGRGEDARRVQVREEEM
jgi:hypothetical protein